MGAQARLDMKSGEILVVVDFELCESNGDCVAAAPEVFELGADDQLRVSPLPQPATRREALEAAAHACPKAAIMLRSAMQDRPLSCPTADMPTGTATDQTSLARG
jgi:ferredoxin